jgi:threonine synthase
VGTVHKLPDIEDMRRRIFAVSISDSLTRETIRKTYELYRIILEPHGAVGWKGLELYLERFGDFPLCVSLETAHPAKFPNEIGQILKITPELPPSMRDLDQRTGEPHFLPRGFAAFLEYLQSNLKEED